jgi:hypothetical protein
MPRVGQFDGTIGLGEDPTEGLDAVTKQYCDRIAGGNSSSGGLTFAFMERITPGPDPLRRGTCDALYISGNASTVDIEFENGEIAVGLSCQPFTGAQGYMPIRASKLLASSGGIFWACYFKLPEN